MDNAARPRWYLKYQTWAMTSFAVVAIVVWTVYPEGGFTAVVISGAAAAVIVAAAGWGVTKIRTRR